MPDKETICNSIYRIFLIRGTDVACFTSNRSTNFSFTCEWFLVFQVEPTFCQIGLKRSPEELSTSITVKQSDPVIGWTFAPLCKTSLLVSVSSSRQLDVRFGKNYCTDLLRTNFVLNVFFSCSLSPLILPRQHPGTRQTCLFKHLVLFLFWKFIQLISVQKTGW